MAKRFIKSVKPGQNISAKAWNELVESVNRLSSLRVCDPLNMIDNGNGLAITIGGIPKIRYFLLQENTWAGRSGGDPSDTHHVAAYEIRSTVGGADDSRVWNLNNRFVRGFFFTESLVPAVLGHSMDGKEQWYMIGTGLSYVEAIMDHNVSQGGFGDATIETEIFPNEFMTISVTSPFGDVSMGDRVGLSWEEFLKSWRVTAALC